MQMNKSIGGRLYMGFGLIMVIVVSAFVFNWIAVQHEKNTRALYRRSITMVENLSRLDSARNQNRLFLRNFLLNGDRRESDALVRGLGEVESLIDEIKKQHRNSARRQQVHQLLSTADFERDWSAVFASLWWTSVGKWIPAAQPWPNYNCVPASHTQAEQKQREETR